MKDIENGSNFGLELAKILKIDTSKTKTITIKIQPDDIVLVTTEQFLFKEEGDGILKMLEYYHLEPNKK